jgi:hypothetical protein
MTGFELRNSLLKQAFWPIVWRAGRTVLFVRIGLTEQQVKHKALVPNEKQLSVEGHRSAVAL